MAIIRKIPLTVVPIILVVIIFFLMFLGIDLFFEKLSNLLSIFFVVCLWVDFFRLLVFIIKAIQKKFPKISHAILAFIKLIEIFIEISFPITGIMSPMLSILADQLRK